MARIRNSATGASTDDPNAPPEGSSDGSSSDPTTSAAAPAAEDTPAQKVRLRVLKHFRFIHRPIERDGMLVQAGERIFAPGDHEFDPNDAADAQFLNHPWVRDHLADGAIEHPQTTLDRLQAEHEAALAAQVAHEQRVREAEAALARASFSTQKTDAQSQAFLAEMNTPINQLKSAP